MTGDSFEIQKRQINFGDGQAPQPVPASVPGDGQPGGPAGDAGQARMGGDGGDVIYFVFGLFLGVL